MASKPDDAGRDRSAPRKPVPTLDLTATEVEIRQATAPSASEPMAARKPGGLPWEVGTVAPDAHSARPSSGPRAADPAEEPGEPAAETAAAAHGRSRSQAPVAPARTGGGFGRFVSHLAAGLAGGFIALLGADALGPQLGLGNGGTPFGGTGGSALQQRVAALEAASRERGGVAGGDIAQKLAAADTRLARLEETARNLAGLPEATGRLSGDLRSMQERLAQQAAPNNATERLAKLEDTLTTLAASAETDPQKGRIPQLAALSGRIKDMESALATQTATLRRDLAQAIETRAAQSGEATEATRAGQARLERDLAATRTDTAKLVQRVEAVKADADRLGQTLTVVQEETGKLRSGLDAVTADVDAKFKAAAKSGDVNAALQPVTGKLAAIEQSVQSVVRGEEDRRANVERILLMLELANLKRVLDRGQGYAAELAEVKKAAGGRVDLGALDRFKDRGVATTAELLRDFRPAAGAALDAETEPENGSVLERLVAGAKSIVRVRKVQPASGDKGSEAVIGRMEAALKEGRLGAVLEEAKALEPRSRAAAQDWLDKVEARYAVDRAVAGLEGQLKTSLGGARPAPEKSSN